MTYRVAPAKVTKSNLAEHRIHVFWKLSMQLRPIALCGFCALLCLSDAQADEKKSPLGRFITVSSPVDLTLQSQVKKAALELESQSQQEERDAVLVLEIMPGTSSFGGVRDLADILTSHGVSHVRTVAWLPKSVTGHNVIVALACREIVMHPDAEIGDIGSGQSISDYRRGSILDLVRQRHNPQLSTAMAIAMMDRNQVVLRAEVEQDEPGSGRFSTVVATPDEIQELGKTGVTIKNSRQIKEAGSLGVFKGSAAAKEGVLISRTAKDRLEIMERYGLPAESLREDSSVAEGANARLIKASGELTPMSVSFIERQLDRALGDGANLIVFHFDAPFGDPFLCDQLAQKIADVDKKTRTVAYIPNRCISGGTVLAMACDEIYMHADAMIGAAATIRERAGEEMDENDRLVLRESLRAFAEKKNRPPAVLQAMVDSDVVVFRVTQRETSRVTYMTEEELRQSKGEWNQGNQIPETVGNELLLVNGTRAEELKISRPTVSGFEDMKMRLGVSPEESLEAAEPNWIDTLIFVLNSREAKYVLLVIAIVGIYLEMHMTSGLFGIASALAIALFFWATFLGGTAGWLEMVLFVVGLGCIAMEVFVLPGFGIFGITGGLLTLVALVMACQTFSYDLQQNIDSLTYDLGTVGGAIASVLVFALIVNRYLPKTRLFNRMVLNPPGADDYNEHAPRLRPEYTVFGTASSGGDVQGLVGSRGLANTDLRPSGKIEVDGRIVEVISEGPYINAGAEVEVVSVAGNRVVVRIP